MTISAPETEDYSEYESVEEEIEPEPEKTSKNKGKTKEGEAFVVTSTAKNNPSLKGKKVGQSRLANFFGAPQEKK